jgi:hypothetical protein
MADDTSDTPSPPPAKPIQFRNLDKPWKVRRAHLRIANAELAGEISTQRAYCAHQGLGHIGQSLAAEEKAKADEALAREMQVTRAELAPLKGTPSPWHHATQPDESSPVSRPS